MTKTTALTASAHARCAAELRHAATVADQAGFRAVAEQRRIEAAGMDALAGGPPVTNTRLILNSTLHTQPCRTCGRAGCPDCDWFGIAQ